MAGLRQETAITTLITGDDFNRDLFRTALSRFASGVTVVTGAHDGERTGMTVSAFSSISLEPHLVMIALTEGKATTELIRTSGWFVVNILAADQQPVSDGFAWRDVAERYEGIDWSYGPNDLPIIDGSLATLVCRVHDVHVGGDHLIFVGEAVAGRVADGEPLVYSQGRYRSLNPAD
jgi:flavin reductase (DIM6/NTAB) family NADH-FMN oxidoreductase RutF